jgi:hypothetical protein
MQAIQTKYLGPTNHRGSRVKAWCDAGKIIVSWDYALNAWENHQKAAVALAEQLQWPGLYVGGALPNGDYAFVMTEAGSTAKHECSRTAVLQESA